MKRFLYRAHRGTSLVEILVAMVILLVGIYSLVRLFPSGFTTIIYGRNVTQAQALARGMLEKARLRQDTLPEAILAFNPLTRDVFPALPVNEELTPFVTQFFQAPDARFSDANKIRRVKGESIKVPAPTTNSLYMPADGSSGQRAPVSIYILNFSPLYSVTKRPKSQLGGVTVYAGTPFRRVVFNGPPDDQELARLDLNSYGIDYGNAMVYFKPVPYERRLKMDCPFIVEAGAAVDGFVRGQMQRDNCLYLRPNAQAYDLRQPHPDQPNDCPFTPLPTGARIEQDEESIFRAFALLPSNQPFSGADPYQFRVLNSVVGILGFNPLAASIRTADGSGITAKIDYDVDDWHIIHDDRTVPFAPPHTVKLTLNNLARIGDVDEYKEQYTSLIKDYNGPFDDNDRPALPTGTVGVDLLVVDLDTGLTLDSRTLQRQDEDPPPPQDSNNQNGEINYLNGSIRFGDSVFWTLPTAGTGPATPAEPIAGKRIRIYYRTQQNWAVQMIKAYSNYRRETDATVSLAYGEFLQHTAGYLFFPIQDHDQAVLVDYTWVHRVDGQDIVRTETGEFHQISDPVRSDSPQNLINAPYPYWWIQVDAAQLDVGPDGRPQYRREGFVPDSVRILRVRGVSVRARAIWREGDRWRKLDLDSYIGRDRGT